MKLRKFVIACVAGLSLIAGNPGTVFGQAQQRPLPLPAVVPPPKEFATAEEHYKYLLNAAHGGTKHTYESVPKWEGLWSVSGSSIINGRFFTENGKAKPGILTPAYEKQFKQNLAEIDAHAGQQLYDRITECEPAGYPRFMNEFYLNEFANTPTQSWQFNDLMNETRRIYIGQDHKNVFGNHSWLGDTIGFWDGDKLVTWTKDVYPGEYQRSQPLTSNQFEAVEVWQLHNYPEREPRIEVQVTFYDKVSLLKPINGVYTFTHQGKSEQDGVRLYYWECSDTSNSYRTPDGNTNYHLPGEPGFKDAHGSSPFPDLPGQSRSPEDDNSPGLGADGIPNLGGGNRR